MSFIGPRAEWNKLVRNYEQQFPYYHLRHLVRPGLTGWAQIHGRDELPIPQKVELDAHYARHQSLALDLRIIWMTFLKVLLRDGVSH